MLASILLGLLGALVVVAALVLGYFALATRRIAAQAEKLVPASGSFVDIDGNRIHYVETGEGLPIVFVHGLGGQLHHFRHPLFAAFGPGYRLIALDRPGSGYSVRRRGAGGSLPEQAEILKRFIERLGLEKPLLVGHSLGGAIALTLAVEHPETISGIALIAPLTHLETELRPEFRSLYIPWAPLRWVISRTIAVPASLKYAERTLAFVFGPQPVPAEYAVEGGGWAGLRPSHLYASATDLVAIRHDLGRIEGRYGEIRMPVGLLFGTADRVLGFAMHGESVAERIEGIDFERVDGLGHMAQFIEPERTTAFIRRIAERAFKGRSIPEPLPEDGSGPES